MLLFFQVCYYFYIFLSEVYMSNFLFDFDGTLVDSVPVYRATLFRILDENNVPYGDDLIKIVTPLGFPATARYFVEKLGLKLTPEYTYSLMLEYMTEDYSTKVEAKPNVISVLRELKAQGHSMSILSGSPHSSLDPCLARLGITELFDNIWSCNDFNTGKSDPQIYHRAAELMGTTIDKVIFLDDNFNSCQTAKNAGATVYGVYDDSSREYIDEIKAITDRYIYDFSELIK